MGPDVFSRAWADLTAPRVVGDVNNLSPEQQRALIKEQMARDRAARRGAVRGG